MMIDKEQTSGSLYQYTAFSHDVLAYKTSLSKLCTNLCCKTSKYPKIDKKKKKKKKSFISLL